MSEMFISILKGEALYWLLNSLSTQMAYSDIADAMIKQYNRRHRKAPLLSELDRIRLSTFKQILGIDNDRTACNHMIKYLDRLVSQLAADFQTEAQKTRFLKNAVFGLEW